MVRLAEQRCFNHAAREAAARCPACRRFYCRECVTEHGDRLLCAACLTAETAPAACPRRSRAGLRALIQGLLGWLIVWVVLLLLGRLLLELPSEFHEGTVWRENWWEAP